VGWSDLGCAMENLWAVSMGRHFFCMSTVGPPNKNPCMSTSKNKDSNNKSKQNYPNYQMQMQMMLLKPVLCLYTTTRSGRFTANTTNWKTAQYQCVGQDWWNYIYLSIQCRAYLQCSYLQVFFITKVYYPNLDWVGHEIFFVRLDGV
jgi:hypothetical protein